MARGEATKVRCKRLTEIALQKAAVQISVTETDSMAMKTCTDGSQENGASRYYKVLKMDIFMYILIVFGGWNSIGFIPRFCLIKTLYSVGNWIIEDEEAIGNVQMDTNCKKAMHFITLIKQYQELALIACDAGEFLGRRSEITWEHGEGELREWSESKGDVLYQLGNYCENRVLNLKRLLKELIQTQTNLSHCL